MTPEQSQIAGEFVDELVALQVLQEPPPNRPTECNAPLFLVPKEGQPGQWRCIANLLDGGQNSVVGNDPVFLPRVSHILSQMYTGGYSAVVDASKFFYQFSTRSDERKYLGMVAIQSPERHMNTAVYQWELATHLLLEGVTV